jgi:heme/copper-type cytochrome/quinol oxidase subunit 2
MTDPKINKKTIKNLTITGIVIFGLLFIIMAYTLVMSIHKKHNHHTSIPFIIFFIFVIVILVLSIYGLVTIEDQHINSSISDNVDNGYNVIGNSHVDANTSGGATLLN